MLLERERAIEALWEEERTRDSQSRNRPLVCSMTEDVGQHSDLHRVAKKADNKNHLTLGNQT
jgi:hypothetical protein